MRVFARAGPEIGNTKGISWKTAEKKSRTLYLNTIVHFMVNNIYVILLKTSHTEDIRQAISKSGHYIALGELKGGIDPADADEHWKTAKTALDRIKAAFKKDGLAPRLFFISAAIENKMAVEVFGNMKSKYLGLLIRY
jgi:hypothetical protein